MIIEILFINLFKLLKKNNLKVNISDEYADIPGIIEKNKLIKESDIIIIGVPFQIIKKFVFQR